MRPVSKGGGTFKISDIAKILTMPKIWLAYIALTCLYLTGFAFTYIMPLLSNVFIVPLATVTLISTIRANLIKVVTGPAAGTLAAKLHTSHKAQLILYAIAFVGMALLVIIPWGPASVALAMVSVVLLAVAYPNRSDHRPCDAEHDPLSRSGRRRCRKTFPRSDI